MNGSNLICTMNYNHFAQLKISTPSSWLCWISDITLEPTVLVATFKVFYVWKSFAKCMQVSDGKNKFTVKEFFKSVNIKHVIKYHGWSMGSNFLILQHWILKKVMLPFYSRFSILWVGRRYERAISSTDWTMQFWWTWGGGHSAVLTAKESCQMKN